MKECWHLLKTYLMPLDFKNIYESWCHQTQLFQVSKHRCPTWYCDSDTNP